MTFQPHGRALGFKGVKRPEKPHAQTSTPSSGELHPYTPNSLTTLGIPITPWPKPGNLTKFIMEEGGLIIEERIDKPDYLWDTMMDNIQRYTSAIDDISLRASHLPHKLNGFLPFARHCMAVYIYYTNGFMTAHIRVD